MILYNFWLKGDFKSHAWRACGRGDRSLFLMTQSLNALHWDPVGVRTFILAGFLSIKTSLHGKNHRRVIQVSRLVCMERITDASFKYHDQFSRTKSPTLSLFTNAMQYSWELPNITIQINLTEVRNRSDKASNGLQERDFIQLDLDQ